MIKYISGRVIRRGAGILLVTVFCEPVLRPDPEAYDTRQAAAGKRFDISAAGKAMDFYGK